MLGLPGRIFHEERWEWLILLKGGDSVLCLVGCSVVLAKLYPSKLYTLFKIVAVCE